MAALTGNAINTSYQGLLKTTDNGALSATEKNLTDGLGNASTLSMGTASASFTGTLDLSGATVTGLPVDPNTTYDLGSAQSGTDIDIDLTGSDATTDTVKVEAGTNITLTKTAQGFTIDAAGGGGAAGLVNGSFSESLKNADSLVTTATTQFGVGDITIGNAAQVLNSAATNDYYGGGAVVIGDGATYTKGVDYSFATIQGGVSIGKGATSFQGGLGGNVAIGANAQATAAGCVAIGSGYNTGNAPIANSTEAIAIGFQSEATNSQSISIGKSSDSKGYQSVAIGGSAIAEQGGFQTSSVAIGGYAIARADQATVVGSNSKAENDAMTIMGAGNAFTTLTPANTIVVGANNYYAAANHRVIHIGNDVSFSSQAGCNDTVRIGNSLEHEGGFTSTNDISNSVQIGLLSKLGSSNTVAIGRQANASGGGGTAIGRNSLASGENSFAGPYSTAANSNSAAFNGVSSTTDDYTAVANLEVIGNGNAIKLTSPNGTTYSVTVSDAGALVVA